MRTSKRLVPLLLGIGLVGLLLVGVVEMLRRPPAPLDGAKAIAQTSTWISEFGNPTGYPLYYWTAGNTVTYFGNGWDSTPHLFQISGAKLNAPGREGPAVNVRGGYAGQLSPDGKWFVEWHQNRLRQRVPTFVAMQGGQRIVGQPTWASEGIWTPGDSPRMLCAVWRGTASIDAYSPDGTPIRKIPLPRVSQFYNPQVMDAKGSLTGFKSGAYFINFADTSGFVKQNSPFITMVRVDMTHPDRPAEEWQAAVPRSAETGSCLLSPSGDRILWTGRADMASPLLQKIRNSLPKLGLKPKPGYRWLVSGLKGENMHEIAAFEFGVGRAARPFPYSSPRWMPDSRHISFIHGSMLYVRPVD